MGYFKVVHKFVFLGMSRLDIWDMCVAYSDHFKWPSDVVPSGSKGGKSEKGSIKGVPNFLDGSSSDIPYHLVASCTDMRHVSPWYFVFLKYTKCQTLEISNKPKIIIN